MKSCEEYVNLISREHDELFDEEERAAVESHIEKCEDCRNLRSDMKKMVEALKSEEMLEEFPRDLREGVYRALLEKAEIDEKDEIKKENFFSKIFDGSMFAKVASITAVAAALMLFAAFGGAEGVMSKWVYQLQNVQYTDVGVKSPESYDKRVGSTDGSSMYASEEEKSAPEPGNQNMLGDAALEINDRSDSGSSKITRSASISIMASDVKKSVSELKELALKYEALIDNENVSVEDENNGSKTSGSLTVRVPAKKLDEFLGVLADRYDIKSTNISAQNLTLTYNDVETNLKNLRLRQDALRKLMKKANLMEDVLSIDRELNQVKTEIDRYMSDKKYLDAEISHSTVNIEVSEGRASNKPGNNFINGLIDSGKIALSIFLKSLYIIALLLPYFLVASIIYFVVAKIRKIVKKRDFVRKK